jgi:tRNA pseudouridine(55) synthase
MIFTIHKEIGETPLEAISKLKLNLKEKASYAGRLDPMASGKLLVLTGEDCKRQNDYHNIDKSYNFDLILGFQTDTLDILGIIQEVTSESNLNLKETIPALVDFIKSIGYQEYPLFSSARVNGKTLWELAKLGTIPEKIPGKPVSIYTCHYNENNHWTLDSLSIIKSQISKVSGSNFRQKEILEKYEEVFQHKRKFPVINFDVHVSSGVYIRELGKSIGNFLKIPTTCINIKRTNLNV